MKIEYHYKCRKCNLSHVIVKDEEWTSKIMETDLIITHNCYNNKNEIGVGELTGKCVSKVN